MCNTVAASVFLVHVLVLVEVLETPITCVPSPSIEVGCVAVAAVVERPLQNVPGTHVGVRGGREAVCHHQLSL